jgi:hypothetical protein
VDHRVAQPGHCRCTCVARLLSKYCQCEPQLRLLRQSEHLLRPQSQFGQGSQARREASACGTNGHVTATVSLSMRIMVRLGYPNWWGPVTVLLATPAQNGILMAYTRFPYGMITTKAEIIERRRAGVHPS